MEAAGTATPPVLTSVLALAVAMRALNCTPAAETLHDLHTHESVVPLYAVSGGSIADEAASAVQALEDISDRMRRLHDAYGEWREFDAGAYFDLSYAQTRRLVRVSERVSTVHVTFYADLLLPSFRAAEHHWYYCFCPSHARMLHALRTHTEPADAVDDFTQHAQPEMIRLWTHLHDVMQHAYAQIQGESVQLYAYLCNEERARWTQLWQRRRASAIDPLLVADVERLPTLTLSTEFPLPASRQPGRLRRLRTNRTRGGPARFLRGSALDD